MARTYPSKELQSILDKASTHETDEVRKRLGKHPRIHLHFTPTSGSWMNQVETCFSPLSSRAVRRGAFKSVRDVIQRFRDARNDDCHTFKFVKIEDDTMAKANRKDFIGSGH